MATEDQNLRDAQYRKSLSIAFFNATNAAIELVREMEFRGDEERKNAIIFWRDWFLTEHREYYANTIAGIGSSYVAADTIARIEATQNNDELFKLWVSLSEDERRDGDILKAKDKMKAKHEKA